MKDWHIFATIMCLIILIGFAVWSNRTPTVSVSIGTIVLGNTDSAKEVISAITEDTKRKIATEWPKSKEDAPNAKVQ
ncbi:MAG: hypothetical protein WC449_05405 [Candidatus Paceibacterota bacterium]